MDHDRAIQQMQDSGRTDGPTISALTEALYRSVKDRSGSHDAPDDRDLSALAEQHFCSASWMGWLDITPPARLAQTWKAAQQWKPLNPGRFGETADLFTERLRRRYGDELADHLDDLGPDGLDAAADLIERAAQDGHMALTHPTMSATAPTATSNGHPSAAPATMRATPDESPSTPAPR